MSLTITDAAVDQINYLLQQENNVEELRFRITISSGGCSGFQYDFKFDSQINADDQVIKINSLEVVIDDISLSLVDGSQLDYVEDMASASFVIKNPNAASSCGCGNSFSI